MQLDGNSLPDIPKKKKLLFSFIVDGLLFRIARESSWIIRNQLIPLILDDLLVIL